MVLSLYQFSVHGLYRPRHRGFFGYVATTLVMVGVSILRSSAKMSSDKVTDVSGMERSPCGRCHVLARLRAAGKSLNSWNENEEDEDCEQHHMDKARQDVRAAAGEGD